MADGTDAIGLSMMSIADMVLVIDPPGIKPPVLRPVLDYWELKRGTRAMPARRDIDPSELKPYLRHLCLFEPLPGGEFLLRLMGSEVTDRYGRNGTGKTLRDAAANHTLTLDIVTRALLALTTHRRPVLASGTLASIGQEHVLSEALLLPLSDDGANVNMILSATRYVRATPGA
ncbi:MAG TPA: PAS domain-containing protein [Stellaceae bacterium]|jgi:hypothetical protein|nr:PAS domain-containing protein [Stellaceae bacterium]